MQEVENPARLEGFRQQIREMVHARKLKDGTLASIVNVDELGKEEMLLWEQYKQIMSYIRDFNEGLDTDESLQRLDILINLVNSFGRDIEGRIANEPDRTKQSRLNFLAFLNNRNPIPQLRLARKRFDDESYSSVNLVKKLKDHFKGSIDLYINDSWKNQTFKTE